MKRLLVSLLLLVPAAAAARSLQTEARFGESMQFFRAGQYRQAVEGFMDVLLAEEEYPEAKHYLRLSGEALLEQESRAVNDQRAVLMRDIKLLKAGLTPKGGGEALPWESGPRGGVPAEEPRAPAVEPAPEIASVTELSDEGEFLLRPAGLLLDTGATLPPPPPARAPRRVARRPAPTRQPPAREADEVVELPRASFGAAVDAKEYYRAGLKAYSVGNLKVAIQQWEMASGADPNDAKVKRALERALRERQ